MNVGPAAGRTLKSGRFDASMISMIRSEESNYMTPVQVRYDGQCFAPDEGAHMNPGLPLKAFT